MNAIPPLLFFIVVFLISPVCLAQKKIIQPAWFVLTTYNSNSMEVDGKILIKNVNKHLSDACTGGDPISTKELWEETFQSTDASVDIEDGPSDSNGRVLAVTISLTYRSKIFIGGISYPYSSKIYEVKFYRNKSDCINERENLKKWLTEKNAEYRSAVEKYK
jgi:hypothetical protein